MIISANAGKRVKVNNLFRAETQKCLILWQHKAAFLRSAFRGWPHADLLIERFFFDLFLNKHKECMLTVTFHRNSREL